VYPAAGFRNNSSGSLYNEGSAGVYWSASPYGSSGYASYLYFGSGDVGVDNGLYRAYGFPVRCAQE
jgi:hypothetical protein